MKSTVETELARCEPPPEARHSQPSIDSARKAGHARTCARSTRTRCSRVIAVISSRGAVHDFLQRIAIEEAAEIVDEQPRDEQVAPRVRAADMRQDDDVLGGPERMIGGQRLLAKYVQHRTGDLPAFAAAIRSSSLIRWPRPKFSSQALVSSSPGAPH